jgi:drug/metabolite transporter (DMT)-like permease
MMWLNQLEVYMGGCETMGYLLGLSQYSGMSLLFLFPASVTGGRRLFRSHAKEKLTALFPVALFDLADTGLTVFGLKTVGSSVYIVVFSSVTVWTAMIRWCILKRAISALQWAGVLTITAGLAVAGVAGQSQGFNAVFFLGVLSTLGAALCDAFMYVSSEKAMSKEGTQAPSEHEVCAGVGAINLALVALYIGCYSAAGMWSVWVSGPINNSTGAVLIPSTPGIVAGVYVALAVVLLVHYLSFYFVVNTSSSVTAGVNKACQSAGVFVLSDLLFCGLDRRECFSVDKGVSCALVTVGTVLFAWASSRAARTEGAAEKQSSPGVSFFGHDGDSNMIGSRTGEAAADYLSATPAPVPVPSLVVGSRASYSPLLSDD